MFFEACLSLPHNPREAGLLADNLEALARALREWPAEAWQKVVQTDGPAPASDELFARLVRRTAPVAQDRRRRQQAIASAESVAEVLRVLWPEARGAHADADLQLAAA